MLWLGILVGLSIGLLPFIPWLIKAILWIIALLGAGIMHVSGDGHISPAIMPWLLIAAVGLIIGLIFGRGRGLKHLGEHDFRTRMNNIRNISRF